MGWRAGPQHIGDAPDGARHRQFRPADAVFRDECFDAFPRHAIPGMRQRIELARSSEPSSPHPVAALESPDGGWATSGGKACIRSEELTSEIQSLMLISFAVF